MDVFENITLPNLKARSQFVIGNEQSQQQISGSYTEGQNPKGYGAKTAILTDPQHMAGRHCLFGRHRDNGKSGRRPLERIAGKKLQKKVGKGSLTAFKVHCSIRRETLTYPKNDVFSPHDENEILSQPPIQEIFYETYYWHCRQR
jgi:hypothetical protein